MHDQARYKSLAASDFFGDRRSARAPVEGTVARGFLNEDSALYTGKVANVFIQEFPLPLTEEIMRRGQERYNIFCGPCHDRTGNGMGMVVRRGFRRPPSFHIDRLRESPVGYYFDVITNGFGAMSGYAAQIPPHDRWAITAYVRALQLSQHAKLEDIGPEERKKLEAELQP